MLLPSFFSNNSIDNFFDDDFSERFKLKDNRKMSTDIVEQDDHYEMKFDLPGFNKEDINVSLNNGNLIIEAQHKEGKDEKDEDSGNYIRRERYMGKIRRSFYVGDKVSDEDIYASFDNGILQVNVPKSDNNTKKIDIN